MTTHIVVQGTNEVLKELPEGHEGPEDLEKVLKTVSDQIPTLVKGVLGAIFSPEAGKSMGAAAANFYRELKSSGLPEEVAVKMTQDYVKSFTNIGELFKEVSSKGGFSAHGEHGVPDAGDLSKKIEEEVKKKIAESKEHGTE